MGPIGQMTQHMNAIRIEIVSQEATKQNCWLPRLSSMQPYIMI